MEWYYPYFGGAQDKKILSDLESFPTPSAAILLFSLIFVNLSFCGHNNHCFLLRMGRYDLLWYKIYLSFIVHTLETLMRQLLGKPSWTMADRNWQLATRLHGYMTSLRKPHLWCGNNRHFIHLAKNLPCPKKTKKHIWNTYCWTTNFYTGLHICKAFNWMDVQYWQAAEEIWLKQKMLRTFWNVC